MPRPLNAIHFAAFALAIGLLWGLQGHSAQAQVKAQADVQNTQTALAAVAQERQEFQAWQLACFKGQQGEETRAGCSISTRFDLKTSADQTNQRNTLLIFSVTYSPTTAGPVAVLSLPLGVYLPSGLALVFGGTQSLRLPFETCNQTGCHAGLLLNPELDELLQDGQSLEVMFQNERQQTIKLPLSLEGYAAASQALALRHAAS